MRIETQLKLLAFIIIVSVATFVCYFSGSDFYSAARTFYFWALTGIGIIIVQNIFIRRAIRDSELPANVRWERDVMKQ